MFQDLAVRVTDLDEASGIGEFLRLVRYQIVECEIKAFSNIAEAVGMIDRLSLHHVKHVKVGAECIGKGECIDCRTGGRGREMSGVQNVLERGELPPPVGHEGQR